MRTTLAWTRAWRTAFGTLCSVARTVRAGLRLLGPPLRAMSTGLVKPLLRRLAPAQPGIVEGDWYGNDTVWRMALDLNRVLFFADRNGVLQERPQRRYFSVIDGIVAGEGEGPLLPTPKPWRDPAGGGTSGAGGPGGSPFDGLRLEEGPDAARGPGQRLAAAAIAPAGGSWPSGATASNGRVSHKRGRRFSFEPCSGWRGHIELARNPADP